jgi:hypothetical protein
MMIFCLRLRMRTDYAAPFHLWLVKAGRQIGIAPTSMTSESKTLDLGNPKFQIYSYVGQADSTLHPEQLMTLFTECRRFDAEVLGIVYQETESIDPEGDEAWKELPSSVAGTPGSSTAGGNPHPHLKVIK